MFPSVPKFPTPCLGIGILVAICCPAYDPGGTDAYDDDGVGVQAWDGLPRFGGCVMPEGGTLGREP